MFDQLRNFLGHLSQAQQGGTAQGSDLQGGTLNPQLTQGGVQSNNFNPQIMQGNIGLQGSHTSPDTSYSGGNDAQAGFPVNNQATVRMAAPTSATPFEATLRQLIQHFTERR